MGKRKAKAVITALVNPFQAPVPNVSLDVFATGEEPYIDASAVPGYFPVFARKQPDGSYDVSTGLFWDRGVTYSQMTVGSELVINTHKALASERVLFGDAQIQLSDEFNTIMKAAQGGGTLPQLFFDDVARNAAGNMARTKRLAEEAVGDLRDIVLGMPGLNPSVNHICNALVGPLEDWFTNLRIRWHTLQRGSFATAGFVLAPIGAEVNGKVPSTILEYPFGGQSTKKVTWMFSGDTLTIDDKRAVKDMAMLFFFTMGALGFPDVINESTAEHWSIKISLLYEKWLRLGLSPSLQDLGKSIQLTMPYMLRPAFHDLGSIEERAQLITFLAGLLLASELAKEDGVSSFIGPSQFTALPSKEHIPDNLIQDCFNGALRMDKTVSASSVTLIKPEYGQVAALRVMAGRNKAAKNIMQAHTWLRPADIDWTPHLMVSDVLALQSAPAWAQYKAIGFGMRGQVIHIWSDVHSKVPDQMRIIDAERRSTLQGNIDKTLSSLTSCLLLGSTPIWTSNTGQFLNELRLGTITAGLTWNTRWRSEVVSTSEMQAQSAQYESGTLKPVRLD